MVSQDVNALDIQHRMPLHYAFVKKEKQLDNSAADPVETVTSLCAIEGVQAASESRNTPTPPVRISKRYKHVNNDVIPDSFVC